MTIRVAYHGGSADMSFVEFARYEVQDDDLALEVAERMLNGDTPYAWNEDQPEHYRSFEIIDADALRAQVAALAD